jgi:isopenicillin-N N-acyltransferase like protein
LSVDKECWRYDELLESSSTPKFDVGAVQQGLDAVNQGDHTLQTMVFEPRELALHVAFGEPPVSDDPLTRIDLRPLLTAPAVPAAK